MPPKLTLSGVSKHPVVPSNLAQKGEIFPLQPLRPLLDDRIIGLDAALTGPFVPEWPLRAPFEAPNLEVEASTHNNQVEDMARQLTESYKLDISEQQIGDQNTRPQAAGLGAALPAAEQAPECHEQPDTVSPLGYDAELG